MRSDAEILNNGVAVNAEDDRLSVVYELTDASSSAEGAFDSRLRVCDQRLPDPDSDAVAAPTTTEQQGESRQINAASVSVEERQAAFDEVPFSVTAETGQTASRTKPVALDSVYTLRVRSDTDSRRSRSRPKSTVWCRSCHLDLRLAVHDHRSTVDRYFCVIDCGTHSRVSRPAEMPPSLVV